MSEVWQVADRIGIINKGHLSYEGENHTDSNTLEALFMEIIKKDVSNND